MCKEVLSNFLNMRNIMKKTINFLNNHNEELINEAVEYLKSQNKPYIYDLENNIEGFKETIKTSYFKWIIDHCNEFSTNFDEKYNRNIDYSLMSAYNDVFKYILTVLPNMHVEEEVKENLEDHLNFLLNL